MRPPTAAAGVGEAGVGAELVADRRRRAGRRIHVRRRLGWGLRRGGIDADQQGEGAQHLPPGVEAGVRVVDLVLLDDDVVARPARKASRASASGVCTSAGQRRRPRRCGSARRGSARPAGPARERPRRSRRRARPVGRRAPPRAGRAAARGSRAGRSPQATASALRSGRPRAEASRRWKRTVGPWGASRRAISSWRSARSMPVTEPPPAHHFGGGQRDRAGAAGEIDDGAAGRQVQPVERQRGRRAEQRRARRRVARAAVVEGGDDGVVHARDRSGRDAWQGRLFILTRRAEECSSVGRAAVSKTAGRGFESLHSCQCALRLPMPRWWNW